MGRSGSADSESTYSDEMRDPGIVSRPGAVGDLPPDHPPRRHISAARLAVGLGAGGAAALVTGPYAPWQAVPLIGWMTAGAVWVVWTWAAILRLDAVATSRLATAEEPNQGQTYLLLLSASVTSLVAVVFGVIKAGNTSGAEQYLLLTSGVATIVVSWTVVHTVFALRYAALYYFGEDGGIDFHCEEKPVYSDFAYMAFTIGMTFQVSDTDLTSRPMRRVALHHSLLAYLFGAVIIAATVNLGAGFAR